VRASAFTLSLLIKSSENYTRFFILGLSLNSHPPVDVREDHVHRGLFRLSPREDSKTLSVVGALDALGLRIAQVERRPAPGRAPFESIYFVEVYDEHETVLPNGPYENQRTGWLCRLQDAARRTCEVGMDCVVLGLW
jgi:prephenate dehydratase